MLIRLGHSCLMDELLKRLNYRSEGWLAGRELEQKQGGVLTGYFCYTKVGCVTYPEALCVFTTGISHQSHSPDCAQRHRTGFLQASDLEYALPTTLLTHLTRSLFMSEDSLSHHLFFMWDKCQLEFEEFPNLLDGNMANPSLP